MTRRPRVICSCCGQVGPSGAHGWRHTCYLRWLAADRPDTGPPPPTPPTESGRRGGTGKGTTYTGQLEDYEFLRATRRLSVSSSAARLCVSVRTAQRYEAALRMQAATR